MKFGWTRENELKNGKIAMIGFIAMIGSYIVSNQVIPGLW